MTGPAPDPGPWYCEAYGPELAEIGVVCFFADARGHACADAGECHRLMAPRRQQLLARINEMAAHGDETGVYLAEQFTHPEQLLGGHLTPDEDDDDAPSASVTAPHPVLRVPVPVLVSWTPHTPGGCRCVCAIFHHGHGACTRTSEPGLLIRLDPADRTPVEGIDPDAALAVCEACYRDLAAEGTQPDTDQTRPRPDPGEHP